MNFESIDCKKLFKIPARVRVFWVFRGKGCLEGKSSEVWYYNPKASIFNLYISLSSRANVKKLIEIYIDIMWLFMKSKYDNESYMEIIRDHVHDTAYRISKISTLTEAGNSALTCMSSVFHRLSREFLFVWCLLHIIMHFLLTQRAHRNLALWQWAENCDRQLKFDGKQSHEIRRGFSQEKYQGWRCIVNYLNYVLLSHKAMKTKCRPQQIKQTG